MGDPVLAARARLARACRSQDAEAEALARTELTEAHLERVVGMVLLRDHKPRAEAVDRICAMLRAGCAE
jgi:hypothetical protein